MKINNEIDRDRSTKIIIEEGSNLVDFEKDINKIFKDLEIEGREIRSLTFKTGIQKRTILPDTSWYSMAIAHDKKNNLEIEQILSNIYKNQNSIKKLTKDLSKANEKIYENSEKFNTLKKKFDEKDRKNKKIVEDEICSI